MAKIEEAVGSATKPATAYLRIMSHYRLREYEQCISSANAYLDDKPAQDETLQEINNAIADSKLRLAERQQNTVEQTKKNLAFCNTDAIIVEMPEFREAMEKWQQAQKEFEAQKADMENSYEQKMSDYHNAMSESEKTIKEKEIEDWKTSYIKFVEEEAPERLQKMEKDLLKPIYDKLNTAADAVKTETGFVWIVPDNAVYSNNGIFDASNLIRKKLGLQTTQTQTQLPTIPQKFAFVDASAIIQAMPEYAKMKKELEDLEKANQAVLNEKIDDYNRKTAEYFGKNQTWAESKMRELDNISDEIEKFTLSSEDFFRKRQQELWTAIEDKAKSAMQAVSVENDFAAIIDKESELPKDFVIVDATKLVKKRLGTK
ncbi:MAG: OmpH family outer membrane protein [Candidatus Symbiothrix sp.]|nr:OmpH family outer membrane protein [Candidatus Symbiothrix sp.]